MLRHDNISRNYEPITAAHSFQNLEEQITADCIIKEWLPLVAAEREEMQIVSTVEASQAFGS